jgi:predicted nucleic acid-binding protein
MIVVSDTSPLTALLTVDKADLLVREHGLPVVGLLGVVLMARRRGLIASARDLLQRLDQEAGVYLGEDLKASALKSVGE